MNNNLKLILNCIGIAFLALILVNLIFLGFEIITNGLGESWSFVLKHGVFYSDGNPVGLILRSSVANGFMILVFIWSALRYFRKGRFVTR